jgi:hypothetical protein
MEMDNIYVYFDPSDFGGDNPFLWDQTPSSYQTEAVSHPSNRDFQYDFYGHLYAALKTCFSSIQFNVSKEEGPNPEGTCLIINRPPFLENNSDGHHFSKIFRFRFLIATEERAYLPNVYNGHYLDFFTGFFNHTSSGIFRLMTINGFTRSRLFDTYTVVTKSERPILVACVASNKYHNHPCSYYRVRKRLALTYAKILGSRFALRGYGWDRLIFHSPRLFSINRCLNFFLRRVRLPWINRLTVDDKRKFLLDSEFSLIVENFYFPGVTYITEKIFDALQAGSIPIYLGPPDYIDYIPSGLVLDHRSYSSPAALIDTISKMSQSERAERRRAAIDWLRSSASNKFENRSNAGFVAGGICFSINQSHL